MLLLELPAALMCHLSAPRVGLMVSSLELLVDVEVCAEKIVVSAPPLVSSARCQHTHKDETRQLRCFKVRSNGAKGVLAFSHSSATRGVPLFGVGGVCFFCLFALANCPI